MKQQTEQAIGRAVFRLKKEVEAGVARIEAATEPSPEATMTPRIEPAPRLVITAIIASAAAGALISALIGAAWLILQNR
jgi:hypothetical protein